MAADTYLHFSKPLSDQPVLHNEGIKLVVEEALAGADLFHLAGYIILHSIQLLLALWEELLDLLFM